MSTSLCEYPSVASERLDAHIERPKHDENDPEDVGIPSVSHGDLPALRRDRVHTDQSTHNEGGPGS